MSYISLFDGVPWEEVGHSVIQTVTLYWVALIGLRLVGRRVFSEKGPQDLIVLLLVSESCNLGLTDQDAGYWGSIASVTTLFVMGGVVERIPFLNQFLQGDPIQLYEAGKLHDHVMKKHMISNDDLQEIARQYGLGDYQDFQSMTLEGGGHITGVFSETSTIPPRQTGKDD